MSDTSEGRDVLKDESGTRDGLNSLVETSTGSHHLTAYRTDASDDGSGLSMMSSENMNLLDTQPDDDREFNPAILTD